MVEVNEPYAPGTPCWVDLTVSDQQAALNFYRDLLGWSGQVGPPEVGGYAICTVRDRPVAGISGVMTAPGEQPPPPGWHTYLASDDADATAQAVTANGGTVLMPVTEVAPAGRMLLAADPTGAMFGVWQALEFGGAQLVNEPGALVWNELDTGDVAAAAAFYRAALGLESEPMDLPDGRRYHSLTVEGRAVGGLQPTETGVPPDAPSHWLTYFSVDDTDSTVDALIRAGGNVLKPPFDMVAGRVAVVQDPQGGIFALICPQPIDAD
ncbi:VOC family protein [Peterkaempfera sp. SMS 1(5)a]|uniref:VOC family protein n=1 Tax=Peterkaempfera podocarpi TaxID=3232308 RepID=UPI00366ECE75